jgi:hypothetical protein
MSNPIPVERIENRIYLIRGQKVMLDEDLARLYKVKTFNLNKAVKRNLSRFPSDFMFQLTKEEYDNLKFQTGISSLPTSNWGGRRSFPYAFTEQGIAMLSSVLNSEQAIQVNIAIMRAFVKMKEAFYNHKALALELKLLEEKLGKRLDKHDSAIADIFKVIRKMLIVESKPKPKIGFRVEGANK